MLMVSYRAFPTGHASAKLINPRHKTFRSVKKLRKGNQKDTCLPGKREENIVLAATGNYKRTSHRRQDSGILCRNNPLPANCMVGKFYGLSKQERQLEFAALGDKAVKFFSTYFFLRSGERKRLSTNLCLLMVKQKRGRFFLESRLPCSLHYGTVVCNELQRNRSKVNLGW